MIRQGIRIALLILLPGAGTLQAQSEEAVRYVITQPVELTLSGTLTMPANAPKTVPVVLLIAGSGPTDRNGNSSVPGFNKMNTYRQLADSLTRRGVAVLRYDKRGSGTNLIHYATLMKRNPPDFRDYVTDAVGFIRQLQADKRFSSVTVAGHSEGSLVGILAAKETKADRFISIAGAGRNIAEIIKVQLSDAGIQGELLATATRDLDSLKAGQTVRQPPSMLMSLFGPSVQPYLISWMKYDPAQIINAFRGPVMIVQGGRDVQVAVSEAEKLKAARPDARYVLYDTMSHILKEAPADRAANIATYADTSLTILPALANDIAAFVKGRK